MNFPYLNLHICSIRCEEVSKNRNYINFLLDRIITTNNDNNYV